MKIARVEAVPVRLPFTQFGAPIIAFGRPLVALETCLVRVETEDGVVGWGETPWGPWSVLVRLVEDFIAPAARGREVTDVPAFMLELQRLTYVIGRYGLTMFALSALDTALWDAAGKAAGLPLCRLLGAAPRPQPGYLSLWIKYKRSGAWSWESDDPEMLAEHTRAAVAAGYRGVKVHGTTEGDLGIVRDIGGDDFHLMIDASCRWSAADAREAAARLAPFRPLWLEEPIFPPEDFAMLARLGRETGLAIAAGENACTSHEFAAMFAARAVSFAQPNVTRVGGVSEFRKVSAMAEEQGVALAPHSFFFGPGFLATLHLAAAERRPTVIERSGIPLETDLYGGATAIRDGAFQVPDAPGLGLDPDPDVLRAVRIA